MRLRAAEPGDLEALNDICARTADYGRDIRGRMSRPELVGAVYADPYVVHDVSSCFVIVSTPQVGETETIMGYVVGTQDTRRFQAWFADVYAPGRLEAFGLVGQDAEDSLTATDSVYLRGLTHPFQQRAYWLDSYPAHLHIDLLPQARRQGWGRRLVEAWNCHARDVGTVGMHLGVGEDNTAAIAFYESIGMRRLGAGDGGLYMGMGLS